MRRGTSSVPGRNQCRLGPNLRLKWAFGFPGTNFSGSQATVAGGRILIGSGGSREGCWRSRSTASSRQKGRARPAGDTGIDHL